MGKDGLLSHLAAELYGTAISPTRISQITDSILVQLKEWWSRPLEPVYRASTEEEGLQALDHLESACRKARIRRHVACIVGLERFFRRHAASFTRRSASRVIGGPRISNTTVEASTTDSNTSARSGNRWAATSTIPTATPAWGNNAMPIQRPVPSGIARHRPPTEEPSTRPPTRATTYAAPSQPTAGSASSSSAAPASRKKTSIKGHWMCSMAWNGRSWWLAKLATIAPMTTAASRKDTSSQRERPGTRRRARAPRPASDRQARYGLWRRPPGHPNHTQDQCAADLPRPVGQRGHPFAAIQHRRRGHQQTEHEHPPGVVHSDHAQEGLGERPLGGALAHNIRRSAGAVAVAKAPSSNERPTSSVSNQTAANTNAAVTMTTATDNARTSVPWRLRSFRFKWPPSRNPTMVRATWDTTVNHCVPAGSSQPSSDGPKATPAMINSVTRGMACAGPTIPLPGRPETRGPGGGSSRLGRPCDPRKLDGEMMMSVRLHECVSLFKRREVWGCLPGYPSTRWSGQGGNSVHGFLVFAHHCGMSANTPQPRYSRVQAA
jgi:hypothetical protein